MKTACLSLAILLSMLTGVRCSGSRPGQMPQQGLQGDALLLKELTNEERGKHTRSPLRGNGTLDEIARYHSLDMAEREYVSDINPGGETLTDRARKFGYVYTAIAENLAVGNMTITDVFQGWMSSTEYRANILSETFSEIGIGIYVGKDGQTYYTVVFAQPL